MKKSVGIVEKTGKLIMMLIGDIIRREARIRGNKLAVVDEDIEYSYQEINRRVNRLANTFLQMGIAKGEIQNKFPKNINTAGMIATKSL